MVKISVTKQLPTSFMAPVRARIDAFQAVADPTRRAILDRLRRGEAPVADIAAQFTMSRPAISRHLRVLRHARLVRERRGGDDGRQRLYEVTPAPLRSVMQWAQAYESFWTTNLASLKQHLEQSEERTRSASRRSTPRHP
jgi:DNA-binding transcriptional ArsR family regulator